VAHLGVSVEARDLRFVVLKRHWDSLLSKARIVGKGVAMLVPQLILLDASERLSYTQPISLEPCLN